MGWSLYSMVVLVHDLIYVFECAQGMQFVCSHKYEYPCISGQSIWLHIRTNRYMERSSLPSTQIEFTVWHMESLVFFLNGFHCMPLTVYMWNPRFALRLYSPRGLSESNLTVDGRLRVPCYYDVLVDLQLPLVRKAKVIDLGPHFLKFGQRGAWCLQPILKRKILYLNYNNKWL